MNIWQKSMYVQSPNKLKTYAWCENIFEDVYMWHMLKASICQHYFHLRDNLENNSGRHPWMYPLNRFHHPNKNKLIEYKNNQSEFKTYPIESQILFKFKNFHWTFRTSSYNFEWLIRRSRIKILLYEIIIASVVVKATKANAVLRSTIKQRRFLILETNE